MPAFAVALCLARAGLAGAAVPDHARLAAGYLAQAATPACAAVRLLADEQDYALDGDSAEAALQWLWIYERLNIFNRANQLSQRLGDGRDRQHHNAFWLRQAQRMLYRGEAANVEHALERLRAPLDSTTTRERALLLGTVHLRQRRYAEAADALEPVADDSGGTPFDQYNLALALIGQGREAAAGGRKRLDELSRLPAGSAEDIALRNRINLALGWSWLAAQKGGTARPYFRRVRLDGPDANLALLGLGWAELAPNGGPQFAPVFMGFYHEFPFEPAVTGAERFRRALKPWQLLKQRALHDPPVQEALLAIAYAHDKLGATEDAAAAYRHAIRQYQAEIARLAGLEARLRAPASDPRPLVEREARPGEFTRVTASRAFVLIEDELETQQHCGDALEDIRASADAFQHRLHDQLGRQEAHMHETRALLLDELRRLYLADMAERSRRLKTYLARASLALALLQDRRGTR